MRLMYNKYIPIYIYINTAYVVWEKHVKNTILYYEASLYII